MLLIEAPLSEILLKMVLVSLDWQLNWIYITDHIQLYLYVVDEGQPGTAWFTAWIYYLLLLEGKEELLSLWNVEFNWFGAVNKCNLTSLYLA